MNQLTRKHSPRQDKNCQNIPQANPIIKRQKVLPSSIFPLLQLPKFKYPSIPHSQQTVIYNQTQLQSNHKQQNKKKSSSPKKKGITMDNVLQFKGQGKFKHIFRNPIYKFSNKLSCKNNFDYACMYVNYSESKMHQIKKIKDTVVLQNQKEFQSHFQSGNLAYVAKQEQEQQQCYNMLLMRDMNTSRCTQWFFFRVRSSKSGKSIFRILNFTKNYSIFNNGMKICYASSKNQYQWRRGCQDIKYQQTNINMQLKNSKNKNYFALSFSYIFDADQVVYFSYCYPYTYSMLNKLIQNYTSDIYRDRCRLRNIAMSLGENYIDMLTITNFKNVDQNKKIIFITGRVHPAQTPSSFVCEGMIKFLLSQNQKAQSLRDKFIFKIIPMLNPDGVINGNYRCSLLGYDLNRVWDQANKQRHPQIFGARKVILEAGQKIFLYVDLHAHSNKKGVFMYGCQNKNNPYLSRQIPFLLWKNISQFNYYQCNFSMKRGRQGTARLFISRKLNLPQSYTMQHSYCGPSKSKIHFHPNQYIRIGKNFMQTLQKYYARVRNANEEDNLQNALQQLFNRKQLLKIGDREDADSSSDEELDKDIIKPAIQKVQIRQKPQKKVFRKIDQVLSNETKFKKISKIANFQRSYASQTTNNIQIESLKKIPKNNFIIKEFSTTMNLMQQENDAVIRPRCCSSLTKNNRIQEQSTQLIKKPNFIQTFRYEQQQEQIKSLSNLFLPSLKSASYKKYSRKSLKKNMIHIGKSVIDEAISKKEEIKPIERRRQISWREKAKSYL